MRLAVISDVHGNLHALEVVLADLRPRGVDMTINLGDCVTSPLWPRETAELLESLALQTVRGNHDRWVAKLPRPEMNRTIAFTADALTVEQRRALGALPPLLRFDDVLAVHGTPASDTDYLLEESVDDRLSLVRTETLSQRLGANSESLVLCGHSHTQHVAQASGHRIVVNPGSVGCPRYADNAYPTRHEAGSPHARYAIVTRRAQRWSVELFALEYDWNAVADQARRNGRDDWATGFLKQ